MADIDMNDMAASWTLYHSVSPSESFFQRFRFNNLPYASFFQNNSLYRPDNANHARSAFQKYFDEYNPFSRTTVNVLSVWDTTDTGYFAAAALEEFLVAGKKLYPTDLSVGVSVVQVSGFLKIQIKTDNSLFIIEMLNCGDSITRALGNLCDLMIKRRCGRLCTVEIWDLSENDVRENRLFEILRKSLLAKLPRKIGVLVATKNISPGMNTLLYELVCHQERSCVLIHSWDANPFTRGLALSIESDDPGALNSHFAAVNTIYKRRSDSGDMRIDLSSEGNTQQTLHITECSHHAQHTKGLVVKMLLKWMFKLEGSETHMLVWDEDEVTGPEVILQNLIFFAAYLQNIQHAIQVNALGRFKQWNRHLFQSNKSGMLNCHEQVTKTPKP
jgi:hypothetical protein